MVKTSDIDLPLSAIAYLTTFVVLSSLQPGRQPGSAVSQKLWLDIAAARSRLKAVQVDWHNQSSFWLSLVDMQLQARAAGDREDAHMLLSALDLDEYYRRFAGIKQPIKPAVAY